MSQFLPLAGSGAFALAAAHMIARPASYVGHGIPAATDPRTVRFFGCLLAFFAGSNLIFSALRLSQG
jgi:hypothetical protein